MAAQTHGAVDSLLGLLSSAIKDEARLLGGVQGDVQFIKDEMDSMNGFLMHLTKTDGEHDDQLRAWMKQVRDIAYVAEDCIESYMRDLSPPDAGVLAFLRHLPVYLWTAPSRHRLATQIRELKLRVREVGERRLRYGVTVPAKPIKPAVKPPCQDEGAKQEMEAFRQALEDDIAAVKVQVHQQLPCGAACQVASSQEPAGTAAATKKAETCSCPYFSTAIQQLTTSKKAPLSQRANTIRGILVLLHRCCFPGDERFSCMKMLLCAMFLDPDITNNELDKLWDKFNQAQAAEDEGEAKETVMIFCYSLLSSQQKSCLQYLTAFGEEICIARTSLVRRWVAEGFVCKEQERTPEEVGERCFSELLFRGFVVPVNTSDCGTVKSCQIQASAREFITRIAKSENFVAELPSHLERQLQIRRIVRGEPAQQQEPDRWWRNISTDNLCCCRCASTPDDQADSTATAATPEHSNKDPMDELVHFLKQLPQLYRLNVLDLGGCHGLKKRHLKSICRVVSLKYLSLRNTDVSRLRARHLQGLKNLETLDIRGTGVPPSDMRRIFLPKLKHLLAAGRSSAAGAGTSSGEVPRRICMMRHMETLSCVQASEDGADLKGVGKLQQLRKLGVVVHANDATAKYLVRALNGLTKRLRSLSIFVVTNDGSGTALNISMESTPALKLNKLLALENIDIRGRCSPPSWIKDVKKLANITLCDTDMNGGDLATLGEAHGLGCLRLLGKSYSEPALSFKAGHFKALKVLVVDGTSITSIGFVEGAAPMLEKIVWTFHTMNKERKDPLAGTRYLNNLKRVELRGHGNLDPQQLSNLKQACGDKLVLASG